LKLMICPKIALGRAWADCENAAIHEFGIAKHFRLCAEKRLCASAERRVR
jgi:hypothetical protein